MNDNHFQPPVCITIPSCWEPSFLCQSPPCCQMPVRAKKPPQRQGGAGAGSCYLWASVSVCQSPMALCAQLPQGPACGKEPATPALDSPIELGSPITRGHGRAGRSLRRAPQEAAPGTAPDESKDPGDGQGWTQIRSLRVPPPPRLAVSQGTHFGSMRFLRRPRR